MSSVAGYHDPKDLLGAVPKLALASAVLCGVALLVGSFSPFGSALTGWFMD